MYGTVCRKKWCDLTTHNLIPILQSLASVMDSAAYSWPRPPGFRLGLEGLTSASNIWPHLTSLIQYRLYNTY